MTTQASYYRWDEVARVMVRIDNPDSETVDFFQNFEKNRLKYVEAKQSTAQGRMIAE